MDQAIQAVREQIADAGRLLFGRKLLDISGGNISARAGSMICISPRYAGSRFHWDLRPEQVLVASRQGELLDGEGELSRESKAHFRLLQDFPDGNAVVHSHSQNTLVFCALRKPMPPVLEFTLKFGEIPVAEYAPGGAFSEALAENIAREMAGREDLIRKQAAAVLSPWHGLFVLGRDLLAAMDATERIDWNARTIVLARMLAGSEEQFLAEQRALERLASSHE